MEGMEMLKRNPYHMESDDALHIAACYRRIVASGEYRSWPMNSTPEQRAAHDAISRRMYLDAARHWLARAKRCRQLAA
jgi:hypothetical protein